MVAAGHKGLTESVAAALNVFRSKGSQRALISQPVVVTRSGEPASTSPGLTPVLRQAEPEHSDDQDDQRAQNVQKESANFDVGEIPLSPSVNENGNVVLKVRPAVVSSQVETPAGQTLILTGLRERFDLSGVPVLADVPVINDNGKLTPKGLY